MSSYLIDELQIDLHGITFKKEFKYIPWKRILTEEWNFNFKEKFLFLSSNSTIPFYWVELIPSNPNFHFKPIKIHFPKGLSQQEDFKNLVAYYLLKESNLLETLVDDNNKKANDFIKKIFL